MPQVQLLPWARMGPLDMVDGIRTSLELLGWFRLRIAELWESHRHRWQTKYQRLPGVRQL